MPSSAAPKRFPDRSRTRRRGQRAPARSSRPSSVNAHRSRSSRCSAAASLIVTKRSRPASVIALFDSSSSTRCGQNRASAAASVRWSPIELIRSERSASGAIARSPAAPRPSMLPDSARTASLPSHGTLPRAVPAASSRSASSSASVWSCAGGGAAPSARIADAPSGLRDRSRTRSVCHAGDAISSETPIESISQVSSTSRWSSAQRGDVAIARAPTEPIALRLRSSSKQRRTVTERELFEAAFARRQRTEVGERGDELAERGGTDAMAIDRQALEADELGDRLHFLVADRRILGLAAVVVDVARRDMERDEGFCPAPLDDRVDQLATDRRAVVDRQLAK